MANTGFVRLLAEHAQRQPHEIAFRFLADGEASEIRVTYGELDLQARAIASTLQGLLQPGDRTLLLFPPGLDFIAAFFGSLYAGAVAVPAYPPEPKRRPGAVERLVGIIENAQPSVILTTSITLPAVARLREYGRSSSKLLDEIPCVATDGPDLPEPERWHAPKVRDDTIALLQYTSGSTGAPKGAIVSHGNLYHNSILIKDAFGHSSESRGVIWLPPYHDMGLIGGILQPVFAGFPCVLLSPLSFLQRPLRWLLAVSRYRATTSGGPNFAYDLCVERIGDDDLTSLDLSCWEVAFNGSEPVRQETLHRFASKFSRCGFRRAALYSCYGLAEATLFVTGGFASEEPTTVSVDADELSRYQSEKPDRAEGGEAKLLSSGHAGRAHRVVIAEPDSRRTCSPGSVGEIWVAGPSVARGYWRHLPETEEAFGAHLADTGEGPFLRTGDMGFLKNGELRVTGRLKDLIIIRGRNYHPHDIERVVEQSHDGLRSGWGAAFSVDGDGEERLVVVHELKRRYRGARDDETDSIITAIREAISEALHLEVWAVQLIRPGQIPKTSSGKVQRLLCRERFLAGKLERIRDWRRQMQPKPKPEPDLIVAPPPTDRESLQRWMVSRLSRHLRVEPTEIDVQAPFARYGVDSKQAVIWSGELEDKLGRRLPPTLLYEHPTIESMADYLVGSGVGETPSSIEPIAPGAGNHEPIAIIGMGCRFPGAESIQAFWTLLREGVDAIGEVPRERWDVEASYDSHPDTPGRMNIRWGGFLENVDQFDPQFFGISPREALRMDPQQRLLLEVTWEALDDAGLPPERLSASSAAVFVGISNDDYGRLQIDDPALSDAYAGTGSALSIAANRISYLLNLRGPSMAIDTACSSSLVAVHLACQSLQRGESSLALAGGANLMLSPGVTMNFTRGGFLSPDGRCKAFDSRANGYVRGEGVGMLVLKPLTQALGDGDPIWALIRGSAVNQDGRSNGLTAPNPESQEAVLRQAYANAGISPGEVQYVEAHGTGTFLGDPMEANALGKVLASGRPAGSRCTVGSVKTNIGHLEAAAGVAGLIKVALSLKHGAIPPHLHFEDPNPHIAFEELPLEVPTRLAPWPASPKAALAGVSSFGFGGTNAHVVLQEAPKRDDAERSADVERAYLLPVSAHTPEALTGLVSGYREFLSGEGLVESTSLRDICYTASVRRTHHRYRASVVARSPEQASARLERLAQQQGPVDAKGERRRKVALVFSGQGSQWLGMGRELLEQESVFRERIEQCDELFRPLSGCSVLEELTADVSRSRLAETGVAQPVLFALQLALAEQWRSWGVVADVVVGHSLGEIAAATVAGVLRLEDAVRLVAHRARLCQSAVQQGHRGKMAAVGLSVEEAERAVARYGERLVVAAHNSPTSTVVSGEPEAVEELLRSLAERNVFTRLIQGEVAFHSPQMEPLAQELEQALAELEPQPSTLPIVSTVTGRLAEGESFDAHYWGRNLRERVRFASALEVLPDTGCTTFVELAPHPALAVPITQSLESTSRGGQTSVVLPSLSRHQPDRDVMLQSLGRLYEMGHNLHLRRLFDAGARPVPLPRYPWQRKRYWIEKHSSQQGAHPGEKARAADSHPLSGRKLRLALNETVFEARLSSASLPFLSDHRVNGHVVLPAAAYIEMALSAARNMLGTGSCFLRDLIFHEALTLPDGQGRIVQCVLSPEDGRQASFQISSFSPDGRPGWSLHASGRAHVENDASIGERTPLEEVRSRCVEEISVQMHYRRLEDCGLEYGAMFRGVEQLWRGSAEALGLVELPGELIGDSTRYLIHPAVLDASLQVLAAASEGVDETSSVYMPALVEGVQFFRSGYSRLWAHARTRAQEKTEADLVGDVRLVGDDGEIVAEVNGIRLKRVREGFLRASLRERFEEWFQEIRWERGPHEGSENALQDSLGPAQIAEAIRPEAARLSAEHRLERFSELLPELESLSSNYVLRALARLGADLNRGRGFFVASLADELKVVPRHHRLFGRMMEMLEEDGWLRRDGSGFEVLRSPDVHREPSAHSAQLLARYPDCESELVLLERCGGKLADVLRGDCDPLQLLFPGGTSISAENLYRDSTAARVLNTLVQKAVSNAIALLPAERGVRILEIGAGTGATTSCLLPRLAADRTDYLFTDVSPLFTARAAESFGAYPFVRYRVLDIERDPCEQGFGAKNFDVILAANVLHATRDLRETLSHVGKLLAPGGLLVLVEGTARQRWLDLVFGLTEGWWKFTDHDLRARYPLLSRDQWLALLEESGFCKASVISGDEDEGPALAQQALLLASVPSEPTVDAVAYPGDAEAGCWVVLSDSHGIGASLADRLRSRGARVVQVSPGERYEKQSDSHYRIDPLNPTNFDELLREAVPAASLRGVVHLWSLDTSLSSLDSAEHLSCDSVLYLVQSLVRAGVSPRLLLASRGAQAVGTESVPLALAQTPLWGLGRVIALEHPDLHPRLVDLDPEGEAERQAQLLFEECDSTDAEDQIAFRGRERRVARLVPFVTAVGNASSLERPFRLEIDTPGTLDGLAFRRARVVPPRPGEVQIEVVASGLNFRDVMMALGRVPEETGSLGSECAGRVVAVGDGIDALEAGDEVVAVTGGSFATFATTSARLVVPKPEDLSFEEAATIPIAFLTAYYALDHIARMAEGERLLIHSATGGVGLAAVQLARRAGLEIFATAGSAEKRAYLRKLGIDNVMDSRSLDFAEEVREQTRGEGVDIVLSSLTGEALQKSLSVLKLGGRFLELGHTSFEELPASWLASPESFHEISLDRVVAAEPLRIQRMLGALMDDFREGRLQPLPRTDFPIQEAVQAFRYMARARHIGKIVLLQEEAAHSLPGKGSGQVRSDGSYLVTGGLGGLGMMLARWLVEQGAGHVALVGRQKPADSVRQAIAELDGDTARISVHCADVSRRDEVASVWKEIEESMPPLRGIIHCAGVLDDGVLMRQDRVRFEKVLAPKMKGGWNLHCLSQEMCREEPLDFFVLFSSAASVLGSAGQGNHAAANAFLDGLAHYRRRQGLPALSINWGPWAEIGAVANRTSHLPIRALSPERGLDAFQHLLKQDVPQVSVLPIEWPELFDQFAPGARSPFLSKLPRRRRRGEMKPTISKPELLERLERTPAGERLEVLRAGVRDHSMRILGLDPTETLEERRPLNELGLDSLMAIELRSSLGASLGKTLPATLLFDYPTVAAVTNYLAREVLLLETPEEKSTENTTEGTALGAQLDELSEDEMATLLTQKLVDIESREQK